MNNPCRPTRFRLLVLSETSPEAICHGIGLRAYHLLSRLPSFYDITFLSAERYKSATPSQAPSLRRLHSFFQWQRPYRFEPELQHAFNRTLRDQSFDAVLVMGADLLQYAGHCDVPIIADLVDEPMLAALREIRLQGISPDALRLTKHVFELLPYLRRTCRRARHCILVSQQDARWLRRIVPGVPVSVVPNGVDAAYFRPSGLPVNPREIVFSGIMGFPPTSPPRCTSRTRSFPGFVPRFQSVSGASWAAIQLPRFRLLPTPTFASPASCPISAPISNKLPSLFLRFCPVAA